MVAIVTVMSQAPPEVAMAVPEEVARSAPPVAQLMAPDVSRSEGGTAEGSPGAMAVVERTGGESPLALMSGGSHSSARGEPLL